MPVTRSLWKPSIEDWPGWPKWPCPTCESGTLKKSKGTLAKEETGPSRRQHTHHPEWEPYWTEGRFSAHLQCNNIKCRELVSVCGSTSVGVESRQENPFVAPVQVYPFTYWPKFFDPALPVFPIPEECPTEVSAELRRSFSLIWSDVGSASNRLRSAAEPLLNNRKVRKTKMKKKNHRVRLTLHDRIVIFKQQNPEAADYLLAIKWLGNAGSHRSLNEPSVEDILDGYDLFEHVLEQLFVKRVAKLKRRAEVINKRKGPVRPARQRRRKKP